MNTLPSSFMDQGEFGASSSIADVIEVECEEVYAEHYVRISADELNSRCDGKLYWRTPYENSRKSEWSPSSDPSFSVEARQRRQRDRGRDRWPVLCGRRKPDRRTPGIAALHNGDDRVHGAAAEALETRRVRDAGNEDRG